MTVKECAFIVKFLKRVRKWGPMGSDLLDELDFHSAEVRRLCAQLAASCGCYYTARTIAGW